MNVSKGKLLVALGLVAAPLVVMSLPAAAEPPVAPFSPNPGYEIEAKVAYCTGGGTGCAFTSPQFSFADATIYSFRPGVSEARPQFVNIVCARGNNALSITGVTKEALEKYPQLAGPPGGPATAVVQVHGTGEVTGGTQPVPAHFDPNNPVPEANEVGHHARGELDITVTAPDGTKAQVSGTQVTDNPKDVRTRGGFEIEMTKAGMPSVECHTNVTPIPTNLLPPMVAPPNFESVVGDYDSPNS